MAKQLVGRRNMAMLAELLSDSEFEFFCLVDSAEGEELLGEFFRKARKRLQVVIELGVPGGRSGVRDAASLNALLATRGKYHDTLWIAGVELYERILSD